MSIELPLDTMTLADKLEAMELLWAVFPDARPGCHRRRGTRMSWMRGDGWSRKGN